MTCVNMMSTDSIAATGCAQPNAATSFERRWPSASAGMMRKPPVFVLSLILLSLAGKVAGFFPGGGIITRNRYGTSGAITSTSATPSAAGAVASGAGAAAGTASGAGASKRASTAVYASTAAAAASSDNPAATAVGAAVVVSFGLTLEERLAAKEAVFRRGHLFPLGMEMLDATASAGTLREAVLNAATTSTTTESATNQERVGGSDLPQNAFLEPRGFMPKLLLVLSAVPSVRSSDSSDAAPDGESSQSLLLSVMEALDACEAVPPAIVCCPSPLGSRGHSQRGGGDSSRGFQELLDEFEPALLDTQLADLWRQEAKRHFDKNGLAAPLRTHETAWTPSEQEPKVALNLELDGAWVDSSVSPGGRRWDTSKIVVLDGLVDEKLSKDLLDLVTEPGWATSREAGDGTNSKRPSPRKAPPLSKWERGLSDVESDTTAPGGRGAGAGSWGLTNDGMEWLCREGKHPAVVEVQSRLCKLYPDFEISHMPEAVLGASTPRMVANAPVYGDHFSWHVDADPAVLPPSPWRDYFGTYTNREHGMPLFTTLLIYLDAEWRREWDAETLFLDAPTGTGVFVRPRGGRAVMMDQDVTHRISTPSQTAARPRYSLVWKLVFFPRSHSRHARQSLGTESSTTPPAAAAAAAASAAAASDGGSGTESPSIALPGWGESVRFGSAQGARSPRHEEHDDDHDPPPPPPPPPPGSSMTSPPPVDRKNELNRGDSSRTASDVGSNGENAEALAGWVESDCDGEGASGLPPAVEDPPMVEVKPVGAKGMGLFAASSIPEGVVVGFYTGEALSTSDLDARYPDFEGSEYVMQVGPDRYLDARDPEQSGITRRINHKGQPRPGVLRGTKKIRYINHSGQPNLVVELRRDAPSTASDGRGGGRGGDGIALTTLRPVAKGEELTFDYGEEYFDGEDEASVIEDGEEMQDLLGGIDWGSNTLSA